MQVQNAGIPRTTTPRPALAKKTGAAFGALVSEGSEQTEESQQAGHSSAVNGLLFLQENNDQGSARRTMLEVRAETLLEQLEEMRFALLLGRCSSQKLLAMQKLVNSRRPELEDARLLALLDDIELRVKVEMAKLGL
jgi:hypothetical protein